MRYFGIPELKFTLARFSENSELTPMSLPMGAYIQGRLVGKAKSNHSQLLDLL
jgi:hypothetical protein